MKKIIFLNIFICSLLSLQAQNTFRVIVRSAETKEVLQGATITLKNGITSQTTNTGFAEIPNIPNGKHIFTFSFTGFIPKTETYNFPVSMSDTTTVFLLPSEEELSEVIVQSVRTSRTIDNTPTRIESIDGEELDEKNNMRPANVTMLLHESTGLQVQQTSATSGNASIRVQGLDGRYTQLLKDGYPNFGNFASGLSILEIPPLDLKQVEIIKGPASTLFGGGAIAGVINFISKTPKDELEVDAIINQSNIGQSNIGIYTSQKKNKIGVALLATLNFARLYDVDEDGFSEIPKSKNFTINPRIYFYPSASSQLMIGNAYTKSDFTGGDVFVIKNGATANRMYFEKNETVRNTTTLEFTKQFPGGDNLVFRQSLGLFDRKIFTPGFIFSGKNTNSFSDLSYIKKFKNQTLISGVNVIYDNFRQLENDPGINQNAKSFTTGLYVQDTWDITDKLITEAGLRLDNVRYRNRNYNKNQAFFLPRISVLYKFQENWSSRIGAGLGYKIPTIFTEQTESVQYNGIAELNNVTAEKSVGGTADVNYKTTGGSNLAFSVNQMFFITSIKDPLILIQQIGGLSSFINAPEPVISRGFETNLKFIYKSDLKLFVGYTFTRAKAQYKSGNQSIALVPNNKVNLTLMYEKEDNFKFGLEGYFTDRQYLTSGDRTPSFWEFGFMAQKTLNRISVFVNFENFTDQRQSNFKRVVNGNINNPSFDEIWNHTEGFVVNGGLKFNL